MKKAQVLTPVGPLKSIEHPPHQSRLGKIFPRSQCSLEKMSLVGRSRHDFKKQAREELFELSYIHFLLSLVVPTSP